MPKSYWKSEQDSETTMRFKVYSRKVSAIAFVAALAVLAALIAAFARTAFEGGGSWNVIAWLVAFVALPTIAYGAILRLSNSAFMRRIARGG